MLQAHMRNSYELGASIRKEGGTKLSVNADEELQNKILNYEEEEGKSANLTIYGDRPQFLLYYSITGNNNLEEEFINLQMP